MTITAADAFAPADPGHGDPSIASDASWRAVFRHVFPDGPIYGVDDMLKITADSSGLHVSAEAGEAYVGGEWMQIAAQTQLDDISDKSGVTGGNTRTDLVVARLDITGQVMGIDVKTGTPANPAVAPTVTQDDSTWEIPLAEIRGIKSTTTTIGGTTIDTTHAIVVDARVFNDPNWKNPRGFLVPSAGSDSVTGTSSASTGTAVDFLTGVTYSRELGRRYEYILDGHLASSGPSTDDSVGALELRRSSTILRRKDVALPAQNQASGATVRYRETATATGADTVKGSIARSHSTGGTANITGFGDTDRPFFVTCEDKGPGLCAALGATALTTHGFANPN